MLDLIKSDSERPHPPTGPHLLKETIILGDIPYLKISHDIRRNHQPCVINDLPLWLLLSQLLMMLLPALLLNIHGWYETKPMDLLYFKIWCTQIYLKRKYRSPLPASSGAPVCHQILMMASVISSLATTVYEFRLHHRCLSHVYCCYADVITSTWHYIIKFWAQSLLLSQKRF